MFTLSSRYFILFLILLFMAVYVVSVHAINDPTLSVYYSFDEEEDTIKDGSTNGNDAMVEGGAKWVDSFESWMGKAIELNGNSTYINMNGPEFKNAPVDGITLAFWVNHTGLTTDQSVFEAVGTDHGSGLFHVEIETEGVRWFHRDGTHTDVYSIRPGPVLESNEWVHFAGTYDSESGEAKCYLDGEETDSASGSGKLSDNWSVRTGIGSHGSARWLQGLLDEFYIFSRALSEDEINQLKDGEYLSVEPTDKLATTWGDIKSR